MDRPLACLSIISLGLVTARWSRQEPLPPQTPHLFYDLASLICFFFLAHFDYGWIRACDRLAYFKAIWIYLPGFLPMEVQFRW
ncbi:ion transporter, partial [Aeromonas veronii]